MAGEFLHLDEEDVLRIAEAVTGRPAEVRDYGLLASAVARPSTEVFGVDPYPDVWSKAAALLHSLSRNHALADGNKRTAWVSARAFLLINGVDCGVPDTDAAEVFVLEVAQGHVEDVAEIASGLRKLLAR